MRHCHFSILYNEIAFLKQKLPFLYQHFDQLIFFDLNILNNTFSNDGSHEFIKEFPDPENKITLIEERDLTKITEFCGTSFGEKRKMFAVGSKHVRDDIDYFWCTDMDEFFNASLIKAIEENIGAGQTALVPHVVFWKNEKWIGVRKDKSGKSNDGKTIIPWTRIARHVPGHMYGHCHLQSQFQVQKIENELIYHFSFIGQARMKFKEKLYQSPAMLFPFQENDKLEFIPFNKASVKKYGGYYEGVIKNKYKIPEYINLPEMLKDLK